MTIIHVIGLPCLAVTEENAENTESLIPFGNVSSETISRWISITNDFVKMQSEISAMARADGNEQKLEDHGLAHWMRWLSFILNQRADNLHPPAISGLPPSPPLQNAPNSGPWSLKEILEVNPCKLPFQWGPVPKVETVEWDCRIFLYSPSHIGVIAPTGNELNPLRWGDSHEHPSWGIDSPIGWWVWLSRGGTIKRPANVKTWAEHTSDTRG